MTLPRLELPDPDPEPEATDLSVLPVVGRSNVVAIGVLNAKSSDSEGFRSVTICSLRCKSFALPVDLCLSVADIPPSRLLRLGEFANLCGLLEGLILGDACRIPVPTLAAGSPASLAKAMIVPAVLPILASVAS
jgi:hypothetical protein